MITLASLQQLENDGLISLKSNSNGNLFIANYTTKVQYNNLWTDLIMKCRGLIINAKGEIIARPFPKFFNLIEHKKEDVPNEPFEVFEKLDGSLGVSYFDENWKIASRGSFDSEQAKKGTEILHSKYEKYLKHFKKEKTYLFEIIYPSNRIVVDYGEKESLILLAIIDTKTGKEDAIENFDFPEKVKKYDGITELKKLADLESEDKEGFVVKFESGLRVKIKFTEYLRLHKIVTELSTKVIWEYLMEGKDFEEVLSKVPDEFYNWVKDVKQKLEKDFDTLKVEVENKFKQAPQNQTRKEFALWAKNEKHTKLLFNLYDEREIDSEIWKLIKPKSENHHQSKMNEKL